MQDSDSDLELPLISGEQGFLQSGSPNRQSIDVIMQTMEDCNIDTPLSVLDNADQMFQSYIALPPSRFKMQRQRRVQGEEVEEEELKIFESEPTIAVIEERILCVDDSTYNLFVIKELLYSINKNFIIDTALNGQEAIDILNNKCKITPTSSNSNTIGVLQNQ